MRNDTIMKEKNARFTTAKSIQYKYLTEVCKTLNKVLDSYHACPDTMPFFEKVDPVRKVIPYFKLSKSHNKCLDKLHTKSVNLVFDRNQLPYFKPNGMPFQLCLKMELHGDRSHLKYMMQAPYFKRIALFQIGEAVCIKSFSVLHHDIFNAYKKQVFAALPVFLNDVINKLIGKECNNEIADGIIDLYRATESDFKRFNHALEEIDGNTINVNNYDEYR